VTVPGKGYQFAATPATQIFQATAVGQDFSLHVMPGRGPAAVHEPKYDEQPAAPLSISTGLPSRFINNWKMAAIGAFVLASKRQVATRLLVVEVVWCFIMLSLSS
jgi:hypothetical protein